MYNNDTITVEVTNSEVDEFLDSGDIYAFYSHSRDLATAVAQDMSFLLNASERHGVTINWGNITPEDVQALAALERDYERALHVWGCSGFRAYARDETHTASDDRLLVVQASRLNEVVNDCIAGVG